MHNSLAEAGELQLNIFFSLSMILVCFLKFQPNDSDIENGKQVPQEHN